MAAIPVRYRTGEVTAVVPVHLPNLGHPMLGAALASITGQTRPPDAVAVAVDSRHEGAAATRNRALATVQTEWTAFLDSDDIWYPQHLERLLATAQSTAADVVYPWFDVPNGWDPFPEQEGQPFDAEMIRSQRNYIPITVLAKTRLLHFTGGFGHRGDPANPCEDWGMWIKCLNEGAKFVHHNGRTWSWTWHDGNTSGRGDRW